MQKICTEIDTNQGNALDNIKLRSHLLTSYMTTLSKIKMLGILLTWDCDSASKSKELKEMHILSSQTKSKELIQNDNDAC